MKSSAGDMRIRLRDQVFSSGRAFSFPELRSSWPAPRIESSGRFQFDSPRFTDFRSFCAVSIFFQNGGPSQVSYTRR